MEPTTARQQTAPTERVATGSGLRTIGAVLSAAAMATGVLSAAAMATGVLSAAAIPAAKAPPSARDTAFTTRAQQCRPARARLTPSPTQPGGSSRLRRTRLTTGDDRQCSAALRRARPPARGGDERRFIGAFLDARVAAMRAEEAHADTSRLDHAQRRFLRENSVDLHLPLPWSVYEDHYELVRLPGC